LGDAVRRTKTKDYLKLEENPDPSQALRFDQTNFENLVGWLYGNSNTRQLPIIGSIRDIKLLDSCLGNDRARKALENGASLAEAAEELEAANASVAGHVERARRSVERASGGPLADLESAGNEKGDIVLYPSTPSRAGASTGWPASRLCASRTFRASPARRSASAQKKGQMTIAL
jgi:hypothetical protein